MPYLMKTGPISYVFLSYSLSLVLYEQKLTWQKPTFVSKCKTLEHVWTQKKLKPCLFTCKMSGMELDRAYSTVPGHIQGRQTANNIHVINVNQESRCTKRHNTTQMSSACHSHTYQNMTETHNCARPFQQQLSWVNTSKWSTDTLKKDAIIIYSDKFDQMFSTQYCLKMDTMFKSVVSLHQATGPFNWSPLTSKLHRQQTHNS